MTGTVRGYVFGAWSILAEQGHLPRDRGSSSIFDDIEAAARNAGTVGDQHASASAWLNRSMAEHDALAHCPPAETPPSPADSHLADIQAANRQLADRASLAETACRIDRQKLEDAGRKLARAQSAIKVALEDLHEGNTAEAIALLRRYA